LFLPILLPVAVFYAHRARREAAVSLGEYRWPKGLVDRPVVFFLVAWVGYLALGVFLYWISVAVFHMSVV
jgi:hypothetical protein